MQKHAFKKNTIVFNDIRKGSKYGRKIGLIFFSVNELIRMYSDIESDGKENSIFFGPQTSK